MSHRLTSMKFRLPRSPWVALLSAFLWIITVHAVAQVAPSPDAPPQGPAGDPNQEEEQQPVATLKVNVNLVSLYFTVHDKHGALIPHLTKDDFNVLEDKVPQKIKNFAAEADQPLTLGILLDTSGSQQNVLPLEQQAGAAFLSRVLRSKDEAFLISFDVNVDLLSDYTNNAHALARAMDKAQINVGTGGGGIPGLGQGPLPSSNVPRGTLLYDAVFLATHDKLQQETGRKAIIILSDGEDQGSMEKLEGAIEAAQKANTIVYVLLIADRGFYGRGMYTIGYTGDAAMRKMAEQTGGRVIDVGNNGKKLEAAFSEIEEELRTQYVASYTPTNAKLDGSYRRIDIDCKQEGMKVQSRKGYYAIPQPE
ncbi:MAG TPA: VWA domain-containing protein [Acidobacteriaceae bacterium]|nr:VWA domain-containing protein [Acidobacteriaceae bacterium]